LLNLFVSSAQLNPLVYNISAVYYLFNIVNACYEGYFSELPEPVTRLDGRAAVFR